MSVVPYRYMAYASTEEGIIEMGFYFLHNAQEWSRQYSHYSIWSIEEYGLNEKLVERV